MTHQLLEIAVDLLGAGVLEEIRRDAVEDLGLLTRFAAHTGGVTHDDDGEHEGDGKESRVKAVAEAAGDGQSRHRCRVRGGHTAVAEEQGGDAELTQLEDTGKDLDDLRSLLTHEKVVAIGEIGLDYYWEENPPRELQQEVFRAQMALARELKLPVIVHDREAHADSLAIVKEFPKVKGVFHCYSGSAEMARQLVQLGWYIGFTGVLTFKNARKALEVAVSIPLDRIVLETDCPFMAPEPFRGKRNDPGKLYRMAEKLAEIRGLSVEEIHEITTENGKRLYRMG